MVAMQMLGRRSRLPRGFLRERRTIRLLGLLRLIVNRYVLGWGSDACISSFNLSRSFHSMVGEYA